MPVQHLRDVRLQGGQVCRVPHVAPDRDGAGHVAVEQPERAAEQVDAGGDHRRAHAVVVQHQRLNEIVEMALVVRGVNDAVSRVDRRLRALDMLLPAIDLAEDGVEGVLQGAVHPVPLGRLQLVQIAVDPGRRLVGGLALRAAQVPHDFFPCKHRLGDAVSPHSRTIARP